MRDCISRTLLSLCLLTVLNCGVFANAVYDDGMKAYNARKYGEAKTYFEKALISSPEDVNIRYMYCQTLVKTKNYGQAKTEYQKIIKAAPTSEAGKLSVQGIKLLDKYINSSAAKSLAYNETDYVKNAYRGGRVYLRPRGMTRIYIPQSPYKALMQTAFSEWQSALGSYVMFTYVGSPSIANYKIKFSDSMGGGNAGLCEYEFKDDTISGAVITIRTKLPGGTKDIPKEIMYHTMLHEIGHSIGILGHSTNPNDIMAQGATVPAAHLSQRDKNTALLLYRSYSKKPTTEAVEKAKVAELTDIGERLPDSPMSFIDLGDEYKAMENYAKAIEAYKKAEALQPSPNVYYRIISIYQIWGDFDNQVSYLKKVLEISPSDMTALNNILAVFQKQGRYQDGKLLLDSFVSKNPDKAKHPDILTYRKVFNDNSVRYSEYLKKTVPVGM